MSRIEYRSDKGHLQKFEKNGSGGIRVDAALTRVGVFEYRDAAGNLSRELKGPETVFDQKALQSLKDAPVTIDHPADFVDAFNWKEHAVGHVSGVPARDPAKADTVVGLLAISDAGAIQQIDNGSLKEVSLGYFAEIADEPGTFEGQKYDRVQRSPVYNHVAIGGHDWGRLGPEIALRVNRTDAKRCDGSACMVDQSNDQLTLSNSVSTGTTTAPWISTVMTTTPWGITTDGTHAGNCPQCGQITIGTACADCRITPPPLTARHNKKEIHMNLISIEKGAVRIDGVPYELEGASLKSASDALQKACDRARQDATEETAGVIDGAIKAAHAAFEAAQLVAELKAEVDGLKGLDIDELVNQRATLVAKAKEVAPDIETDGRTDSEIVDEALRAAGRDVPEGASDDYKRGILDSIEAPKPQHQDLSGLASHGGGSTLERILAEKEAERNNSLNRRGA